MAPEPSENHSTEEELDREGSSDAMQQDQPYSPDTHEENLRRAEGQSFPAHLVIGTPEYEEAQKKKEGFTGIVPRGTVENWEEESLLNDKDKWDRESAWHHLANPHKPLTARHREFARLIARGLPYVEISSILGYSQSYMSILSAHPKLRAEVDRIQEKQLQASIDDRMKEMNHKAFDVIEEMISDENTKDALRFDAAKWLLEKTTGKAAQKIETKDSSLGDFMSLLREGLESKKALPPAEKEDNTFIDVSPTSKEEKPNDDIAAWVDREF